MNCSRAFERSVSTIFAINSPFQALCAIEAIHVFRITEYKILLCLSSDARNSQIVSILNEAGLEYEIMGKLGLLRKLALFLPRYSKFKRAFVGDFRSYYSIYSALKYVSNSGDLVFLDDGSVNISLLKGTHDVRKGGNYYLIHLIMFARRISRAIKLFTLYADIPNKDIECFLNDFSFFKDSNQRVLDSTVYFVGTNTNAFVDVIKKSENSYLNLLEGSLLQIKRIHGSSNIVYVAHGRETNLAVKKLCDEMEIEYVKPTETIEIFLLKKKTSPRSAYGFTSTALYNIKKLFPDCSVNNILFVGNYPDYKEYQSISKYYEKHGITLLERPLNSCCEDTIC